MRLTLASKVDTYNFIVPHEIKLDWQTRGWVWWRRVTRWWRPRTVVTAIDHDEGVITVGVQTWNWFKWRWES